MNSHKITNLANATTGTDALNRQTGDGRYYLATTPLQSITAPTANVSLNSHKITNLEVGTDYKDAMTLGQSLQFQWINARVGTAITSLNSPHLIIFDQNIIPSLSYVNPTVYMNNAGDGITLTYGGSMYLVDV